MLQRVIIKGFKSIKTMDIELRPLNILIGANGAGKSNLISFFKMLNEMMAGRLQQYIPHSAPQNVTEGNYGDENQREHQNKQIK